MTGITFEQDLDVQDMQDIDPEPALALPPGNARLKRVLLVVAGVVLLIALGWWMWGAFIRNDTQSTENAYTNVEVSQVTPLVGGAVRRVLVVNTQAVRAGDVLVELDDTDLRLAVAQAEAVLGSARRKIRQVSEIDASLAGQQGVGVADLLRAQVDLDKAMLDARRRQQLAGPGAISEQELSDAQAAVRVAQATVAQARARVAAATGARRANQVLVEHATVETNPEVLAAMARYDQAKVDLSRAVIRAPIDGVVDQRHIAVGQRVQPGAPVMLVVPVQNMFVEANFKENQLRGVGRGQPVRLTADLYGPDVVYHGRVEGFAGGSGSAFAPIPAQNATGNWIKIVQRLPVRIRLDPKELREHPLRVGLSMRATVDLSPVH